MQLAVKWHVWKALFAPEVWQLPARRRGRLADEGLDGVEQQPAAQVLLQPHNNYLLRHNPRLAELLVDMQQLLAPENVQLLADVQVGRQQQQHHLSLRSCCLHWLVRLADNPTIACTQAFVVLQPLTPAVLPLITVCVATLLQELRWQRQQLVNEVRQLEGRRRAVEAAGQELEGRHQQLEMRLELQRQQLLNELHLLAQQLQHQRQEQQRQREQHVRERILGPLPRVHLRAPEGGQQQAQRQQQGLSGAQRGTQQGAAASQGVDTQPSSAGQADGRTAANNNSRATASGAAAASLLDAGSSRAVEAAGQAQLGQCPAHQGSAGAGAGIADNSGQHPQEQPHARRRRWFGRRA